jgi:hypothetical protein
MLVFSAVYACHTTSHKYLPTSYALPLDSRSQCRYNFKRTIIFNVAGRVTFRSSRLKNKNPKRLVPALIVLCEGSKA